MTMKGELTMTDALSAFLAIAVGWMVSLTGIALLVLVSLVIGGIAGLFRSRSHHRDGGARR